MTTLKKYARIAVPVLAGLVIVMQFFQPERTNPPSHPDNSFESVAQPPRQVADIVGRSCRDCHSNKTVWPWYSRVWPMSYLVVSDVREGRAKINFSEWRGLTPEMTRLRMTDVCSEVKKGDMPLPYYTPLHPETKLTGQEVNALCSWSAERP